MKYPPAAAIILSVIVLQATRSAGQTPSNFEVASSQADSLAGLLAGVLRSQELDTISLRGATRDVDVFVRQIVMQELVKWDFRIRTDSASSPYVALATPVLRISYSSPVSSHIFGSSDIVRTISSEYDITVVDSGVVRYSKSLALTFADTVSESAIPDLENGSYAFLRGRLESQSILDSIVQPLVFIASAGIIVYLFFTLRGS